MRQTHKRVMIVIMVFWAVSGCGLLQEPQAASGPIEAVPLDVEESELAQPEAEPGAGTTKFQIVPGESTVRFEIVEDLRSAISGWGLGARLTVVGKTDQVAGELALNPADLATTQFGEILINARTIETDQAVRNRAIQNQILRTDSYEFITFVPTSIDGLPASAQIGDPVTFNIVGDLTIRETTLEKTFVVTATLVSDTQIEGSASAEINREEFGLTIPDVPNVTFVAEEVFLHIDFIARKP